jgi:RNA polymerase sigma-70 factor, ECF subfamily
MFLKPNGSSHGDDAVIKYIDGLYGYAFVLTGNQRNAEDLVQETYARAMPAIRRLRAGSNIKSWLFTTLRTIWLNKWRPFQTAEMSINENPTETLKDPCLLFIGKMDREQLCKAIQELPIDLSEIILLREHEKLSYQEIAGILNCSIETVMSRLKKARFALLILLSATSQERESVVN